MANLIIFSVGGVGNRLRPLASGYSFSKDTGRDLKLIWNPSLRCLAPYDSIYQTEIDRMTLEELLEKDDVSIYGLHDAIEKERVRKNVPLMNVVDKFGYKPVTNTHQIPADTAEHVMVLHNDFLAGAERTKELYYLQNIIQPSDEILQRLASEQERFKLDESVIGVHARGTDFNTPLSFYTQQINTYIRKGHKKFFVCSDSPEYERDIKKQYGDMIIIRDRKVFVTKDNQNADWCNNVHTSTESVKDSLVDLYMLSYTNFQIFNKNSTFAIIINKMRETL